MRNLTALVLLLLCSLYLLSGPSSIVRAGQICCTVTTRTRIPLKDITSYYKTSSCCPVEAVIFEIKKRWIICADPNAPWVNGHMEKVDLRSKESGRAEPPNRPETFHGAQSTTEKPITTEPSTSSVMATVQPIVFMFVFVFVCVCVNICLCYLKIRFCSWKI